MKMISLRYTLPFIFVMMTALGFMTQTQPASANGERCTTPEEQAEHVAGGDQVTEYPDGTVLVLRPVIVENVDDETGEISVACALDVLQFENLAEYEATFEVVEPDPEPFVCPDPEVSTAADGTVTTITRSVVEDFDAEGNVVYSCETTITVEAGPVATTLPIDTTDNETPVPTEDSASTTVPEQLDENPQPVVEAPEVEDEESEPVLDEVVTGNPSGDVGSNSAEAAPADRDTAEIVHTELAYTGVDSITAALVLTALLLVAGSGLVFVQARLREV